MQLNQSAAMALPCKVSIHFKQHMAAGQAQKTRPTAVLTNPFVQAKCYHHRTATYD